jgi:hypothetical protein
LQAFGERHAGRHAIVEKHFGLAVARTPQFRHRLDAQPQRGQALLQRGRGRAQGVQADAHRHQLVGNGPVGGARHHPGQMHGKPARRGKGRHDGVFRRKPLGLQGVSQGDGECLAELLQRLGRQFLDEEFDQQILRLHAAPFAIFSNTSPAQSRGAIGKPKRARLSR